jgi:hypothetical protein
MIRFTVTFVLLAAAIPLGNAVAAEDAQQPAATEFKVHPIGHIKKADDRMLIVLDKKYQDGLLGLEQWWGRRLRDPQDQCLEDPQGRVVGRLLPRVYFLGWFPSAVCLLPRGS